jgi:CheY-like chemotaxis protein
LNAVIADLEPMLNRLIGEDIEIVTRPDERLGSVMADAGQLEQVLVNLAINARDAMPDGGVLVISTENVSLDDAHAVARTPLRPGSYVTLSVIDTGVGIPADVQPRIFEPFFTTKGPTKGTGLGLSTVYGIIRQSGGHITVSSTPGRGTNFTIYLPRLADAPVVFEAAAGPAPTARGSETLLLVEDEPSVRQLVRRILVRQGYTVIEASNGGEAMRLVNQHPDPIDLVVTDLVMPGMSGRELVERLTALRGGVKALFMSGYTDDDIVRRGLSEPGMIFLPKPFTAGDLSRAVRQALDEGTR